MNKVLHVGEVSLPLVVQDEAGAAQLHRTNEGLPVISGQAQFLGLSDALPRCDLVNPTRLWEHPGLTLDLHPLRRPAVDRH